MNKKILTELFVLLLMCTLMSPIVLSDPYNEKSEFEDLFDTFEHLNVANDNITLNNSRWGNATSPWYKITNASTVNVTINTTLFDRVETIRLIDGSTDPYTHHGTDHDFWNRCHMAIDQNDTDRWFLTVRSGTTHYDGNSEPGSVQHILTSNDSGYTWSSLNTYTNGTSLQGVYADGFGFDTSDDLTENGYTNDTSEATIFQMPNGDFIMQSVFDWDDGGSCQLRSTDNGFTWNVDINKIDGGEISPFNNYPLYGFQQHIIDPRDNKTVWIVFEGNASDKPWETSYLLNSTNNGQSYNFINEIPISGYDFEPSIEWVGNGTFLFIVRDQMLGTGFETWMSKTTDDGASFATATDIQNQIEKDGTDLAWERPRIYAESNRLFDPYQDNTEWTNKSYYQGEGRIWGVGCADAGSTNRRTLITWSDNKGDNWEIPYTGFLTGNTSWPPDDDGAEHRRSGYSDIKRLPDGSIQISTYANYDESDTNMNDDWSDILIHRFGGERAFIKLEFDTDNDQVTDTAEIVELYDGNTSIDISDYEDKNMKITLHSRSNDTTSTPWINSIDINANLEELEEIESNPVTSFTVLYSIQREVTDVGNIGGSLFVLVGGIMVISAILMIIGVVKFT